MPSGTILIGRFGHRGAKKELPNDQSIAIVDCKKMGSDRKIRNLKTMPLAQIAEGLINLYGDKFWAAVKEVIREVKAGHVVCCACMLGKNRSQAVAQVAKQMLEAQQYNVSIEYLGHLKRTP